MLNIFSFPLFVIHSMLTSSMSSGHINSVYVIVFLMRFITPPFGECVRSFLFGVYRFNLNDLPGLRNVS